MHKVKNQKIIRTLSVRTLLANRKKNLIAVLAITLTCILFTTVFSIGGSLIKSAQESNFRQVGGKFMAGIKYAQAADYEKLSGDPAVKGIGRSIMVGRSADAALSKINTEINCADNYYAKSSFCYPEKGGMPKERNEIAASTIVLDALGIPQKLGEKVPLTVDVDGRIYEEEFVLCGFWEGDSAAMAQECWVSEAFANEVAPAPKKTWREQEQEGAFYYAGYWNIDFDFATSWNIEKQLNELLLRNGYDPDTTYTGVNWGYAASTVDAATIALMAGLLFLILASGYLIIYNIFYINVTGEIQEYGLLKTVGTTERQLKMLVRRQALWLSAVGIPVGLIGGTLLAKVLFPIIVGGGSTFRAISFSFHPLLYVGAVLFSLFTVLLSCNKPCRLAGRVSPMEALRYTEQQSVRKKAKKSRTVTPFSLAVGNVGRNRKKMILVVLSLSMSLILLNVVYGIVNSFDVDEFVKLQMVGDYQITHSSVLNFGASAHVFDGVSEPERELFASLDGVKEAYSVYSSFVGVKVDEKVAEEINAYVGRNEQIQKDEIHMRAVQDVLESKYMQADLYGLEKGAFLQLDFGKEAVTWEEFCQGDYLLVLTEAGMDNILQTGDKVKLMFFDDFEQEYTILAAAGLPYSLSTRMYPGFGDRLGLPADRYQALLDKLSDAFVSSDITGQNIMEEKEKGGALVTVLEVEDEKNEEIGAFLENYTTSSNQELTYVSKQTYVEEFEEAMSMYWIVGGSLSFILALIGILNFINAVVTGILTRKREFAIMEAVGMTRKQLREMLVCEGMIYAVLTFLVSLAAGSLINIFVVKGAVSGMIAMKYSFTLLPVFACIPALLFFACIIPFGAYGQMSAESVVERLKMTE